MAMPLTTPAATHGIVGEGQLGMTTSDSPSPRAPAGLYGYCLSAFVGFSIGYNASVWLLVALPWRDGVGISVLQMVLAVIFFLVVVGGWFVSLHPGATLPLLRRLTAAVAAGAGWLGVAFSVSPSPSLIHYLWMTAAVVTAFIAVVSARWVIVHFVVLLMVTWYAWSGWRLSDVPDGPLIALAGVTVGGVLVGLIGTTLTKGGRRVAQWATTAMVLGVSVIACLALRAYPRSYVSHSWQNYPIATDANRLLTGLPQDDPILFGYQTILSSADNGRLAVLDEVGSNRYVLWRTQGDGKWMRTVIAQGFQRPDGRRLFLTGNTNAAQAEASLWKQISGSDSAAPYIAHVFDIVLAGDKVFAVSTTGLWEITTGSPRFIKSPWTRPAKSRSIAVNRAGQAMVVSNYLDSDRKVSELETISLSDGRTTRVPFTQSPIIPEGQWPLVGMSTLPDDTFVTLSGGDVLRASANGTAPLVRSLFDPPRAWADFAISGSTLIAYDSRGYALAPFELSAGRLRTKSLGDRYTRGEVGRTDSCKPRGSIIPAAPFENIRSLASGSSTYVVTNVKRCQYRILQIAESGWTVRNSINKMWLPGDGPLPFTGIPSGPAVVAGQVAAISPGTNAFIYGTKTRGMATWMLSSTSRTTWMQPVIASIETPDGDRKVLAHVNEMDGAEATDATMLSLSADDLWDIGNRHVAPTGATVTQDGKSIVMSTCDGIYSQDVGSGGNDQSANLNLRVSGQSWWSVDDGGCVIRPAEATTDTGSELGFVHAIAQDAGDPRSVTVAQSTRDRDGRWHNMISQVNLDDGNVNTLPGLDLTDRGLIPVAISVGSDSRVCAATINATGTNPLLVTMNGLTREVQLPRGVVASGCAWWKDELIITDANSGDTYAVRSVDRRTHF
ncbi:hypothetical protein [Gordonia bronchialis]|uniref:hypothetical protein n=1 Tax=Gordonia bronchialis TaxID=2054 RepID=UPI002270C967|nr:hypothetical protein [Gordonia bronchialis]